MLVAARLFQQKSVLATTLDDIATKVGTNKATIYSCFNGRKQLLYKILTRVLQEYIGSARAVLSRDASHLEKMESPIVETSAAIRHMVGKERGGSRGGRFKG